jgi:hypothetical protein
MPSVSEKQRRFMAAAAHNPLFARKVGIKQSVAKEFNRADSGVNMKAKGGYLHSALKEADSCIAESGPKLQKKVKKFAEGGKVGALTGLRTLARKFEDALEMEDREQANRIARQMESIQPGSSRALKNKRDADLAAVEKSKAQVLAKGGKVAKFAEGGKVSAVKNILGKMTEAKDRSKKLKDTLARDFRAAAKLKDDDPVRVRFHNDESTTVHAKGKRFRSQAGSDDDRFEFRSDDGEHVPVEFSDDWLNVDGNWDSKNKTWKSKT